MTFTEWFKKEYPDQYYEPSSEYCNLDMRRAWEAGFKAGFKAEGKEERRLDNLK